MEFSFEVENIKCGGCANSIKHKLLEQDGVFEVDVVIEEGLVKIVAEKDVLVETKQILAQLGYPEKGSVQGLENLGAKAKSFVSCAIGRMEK